MFSWPKPIWSRAGPFLKLLDLSLAFWPLTMPSCSFITNAHHCDLHFDMSSLIGPSLLCGQTLDPCHVHLGNQVSVTSQGLSVTLSYYKFPLPHEATFSQFLSSQAKSWHIQHKPTVLFSRQSILGSAMYPV